MAETMLAGGDFMIDLDHQRGDVAGAPLRAVPEIPASATFIGRTKRFEEKVFSGIEEATGELVRRWSAHLSDTSRAKLVALRPSIDLDPPTSRSTARRRRAWPSTTPASGSA
jgi:hypothetical protein